MPEIALNLPFDSNEIKDILCAEFRKRLDGLSPIQGAKEYAKFSASFNVAITVWKAGENGMGKDTLAWANIEGDHSEPNAPLTGDTVNLVNSTFESKDPNEERQDRDMALTVETNDGKGGKTRRKAHIPRAAKKAKAA